MAPLVLAAMNLLPRVIGLFTGPKQERVAADVMQIASAITGENDSNKSVKIIRDNPELLKELTEKANDLAIAELNASTEQQRIVNQTMQTEYATQGLFKSGWRPAFGWCMVGCFTLWVLATLGSTVYWLNKSPSEAATVITVLSQWITAWLMVWGAAFAVLGVNIHSRSKDKQTALGINAGGIFSFLKRGG